MFELLLVFSLLTTALYYLGSRAMITSWLWSRYPPRLARFMDCAACAGTWYGFLVAFGWVKLYPPPSILRGPEWVSVLVIGLCSMVWTPIMAGVMQAGFERLGSAIPEDDDG